MEAEDGDPYSSKDTRVIDVLETMEEAEGSCVIIRVSHPKKVVKAQLKCIYTSACSTGNKQELEAIVQQENYDTVTIMET